MFKGFLRSSKAPIEIPGISIDEVVSRGVNEIFPSEDYLRKLLQGDKKMTLYLGIDPTGPTLHLGSAIVLKKLREFQLLGHKIILLIGDFTGTIGDPTDKSATRKKLTKEEIFSNTKNYKEQASIFLNFSGANPAELKYNSEWLGKMKFAEVLDLASHMTVDQMLKRDMFEVRNKEGKPIYLHEFLYPLLQGYDSVAMDVDGEIGGNDQMFNMLAGRTLLKQMRNKEKFVITMKLLEDSTGKKMGKTEGNMVSLNDSPTDMFGKVMSWTDGMIVPGFELCTNVSLEEVQKTEKELSKGKNPRDIKAKLAHEIVELYHGEASANKAEENFEKTFKSGGVSDDALEIHVSDGVRLSDTLLTEKIIDSKNELRRLVGEGAVMNMTTNTKIQDMNEKIHKDGDFKIGKRRFVKIKVKK